MRNEPPMGQGWRTGGLMIVYARGQGLDWHVTPDVFSLREIPHFPVI